MPVSSLRARRPSLRRSNVPQYAMAPNARPVEPRRVTRASSPPRTEASVPLTGRVTEKTLRRRHYVFEGVPAEQRAAFAQKIYRLRQAEDAQIAEERQRAAEDDRRALTQAARSAERTARERDAQRPDNSPTLRAILDEERALLEERARLVEQLDAAARAEIASAAAAAAAEATAAAAAVVPPDRSNAGMSALPAAAPAQQNAFCSARMPQSLYYQMFSTAGAVFPAPSVPACAIHV